MNAGRLSRLGLQQLVSYQGSAQLAQTTRDRPEIASGCGGVPKAIGGVDDGVRFGKELERLSRTGT
jgi:hypothetical protein